MAWVSTNAGPPAALPPRADARSPGPRSLSLDPDRGGAASRAGIVLALAISAVVSGVAVAIGDVSAAVLCIAALATVFVLMDYRFGVFLLILFMPVAPSTIFPHAMFGVTGFNPLNLLMVATVGSLLVHHAGRRYATRFLPRPLLWLYIAPFVAAGIMGSRHVDDIPEFLVVAGQVSFTDAAGYIRDIVVKPLFLVLFALLVGRAVADSEKPERFLTPLLISVWIMGGLAVFFFVASDASFSALASRTMARQVLGVMGLHANDLGRLYAIAYGLMLFIWANTNDHRLKFVLVVSMGMVVLALTLTFSRGAFFSFVVVNILFLFTRRNPTAYIFALLLLAVIIPLLPGAIVYRMSEGLSGGHAASANDVTTGRIDTIWLPLLPEVLYNPLFGNGLSYTMWSDAMRTQRMIQVNHPHNAYLGVLLDMGIVGLITVIAFFVHTWKGFRKLARDASLSPEMRGLFEGAAAGLVAFMTAGFAGSGLTPVPEQAYLWLAIGMMYGLLARKARA
jgi:O-antigen ligase